MAPRSLLKKGEPYNLDVIKNERTRIDTRLKQRGFYYFRPDNLLIRVDSTVGDHQVDMTLIVKKSTPQEAFKIYRINEVVVFANYDVHVDTSMDVSSLPKFQGYTIIDPEKMFKPQIFSRALVFKPGDIYNRRDHDLSLNRLISLGVFKFVKIRFDEKDTAKNKLNAYYYLTPTEKKSIRFEISGLTQSDDANGGQVSVNWRNRNIFRGAELLTTTVYVGYLRQNLGKGIYTNTTKFGVDVSLFVPRVIGPVKFQTNSGFIPKTRFNIGYEYFDQSAEYTLNSFKASFGYVWKESVTKEHTLEVITRKPGKSVLILIRYTSCSWIQILYWQEVLKKHLSSDRHIILILIASFSRITIKIIFTSTEILICHAIFWVLPAVQMPRRTECKKLYSVFLIHNISGVKWISGIT